ncbi:hypothetical protein SPIROBIBN47_100165 [uncultured spirochete]|uniref:Uncharacterized protein n=1 Tax=uncultured spirochete TaxID=156406 RepID=A0A3P3XFB2_9SPIR|nr:hypothetical protein SPIROBIBN47_100165 [uncultured spirochete]
MGNFSNGPLAQLAEQQTLNLRVEGSNPSRLISVKALKMLQALTKRRCSATMRHA